MFLSLLLKNKLMLKKKNILTLIGFKITWTSCIFGELFINSWFGFVVGLIYLIFFFSFQTDKRKSLYIILIYSFFGYTFDSLLSYMNIYRINADKDFMFLPIWFLVLWPSFASLFVNFFSFLKKMSILSFLLGFIIGPLSYYAGIKLGLAYVSDYFTSFSLIAVFWALLMIIYSKSFIKKITH
jgi:hypothetical protein